MSSGPSPAESPRRSLPRWMRVVLALSLVGVTLCLAVALSDSIAARAWVLSWSLSGASDYEAGAILQCSPLPPFGRSRFDWRDWRSWRAKALEWVRGDISTGSMELSLRTRMLNWTSVREAFLSGKVDLQGRLDPGDRRQMQEAYRDVLRRTSIHVGSDGRIEVTYRGPDPELSASLVNELVKGLTREREREEAEKAKRSFRYYREKQAMARTELAEIDGELREFAQANPWLGDSLSELVEEYNEAEVEELQIRRQIALLEMELVELRRGPASEEMQKEPPESSPEARGSEEALAKAREYFKDVKAYTKVGPRWEKTVPSPPGLREIDGAEAREVEDKERTEPIGEGQAFRIIALEEELEKLNAQKLDANKHVSELYIRLRQAPELLAERQVLDEKRAAALARYSEYAQVARKIEGSIPRSCYGWACRHTFRIVSYARPERTPVQPSSGEIADVQRRAWALVAATIGVGLVVAARARRGRGAGARPAV